MGGNVLCQGMQQVFCVFKDTTGRQQDGRTDNKERQQGTGNGERTATGLQATGYRATGYRREKAKKNG